MTITRIEMDVWGTLIDQKVISVNVASREVADEIIADRADRDDPNVRYIVQ